MVEQALLLWIAGCFVTYFVNDAFAPHALQGLSFPFAVLAVRGWQRLRLPAVLGVVAIAIVTIPGLAYDARKIVRVARSKTVQYYLPNSDEQALKWIASKAPAGGVLAPTPFAVLIPSQTGPPGLGGTRVLEPGLLRPREAGRRAVRGRMRASRAERSCSAPAPRF